MRTAGNARGLGHFGLQVLNYPSHFKYIFRSASPNKNVLVDSMMYCLDFCNNGQVKIEMNGENYGVTT